MIRLNPAARRQHERRLEDLSERIDAATEDEDYELADELIDEFRQARELLEELKQGPERGDDR